MAVDVGPSQFEMDDLTVAIPLDDGKKRPSVASMWQKSINEVSEFPNGLSLMRALATLNSAFSTFKILMLKQNLEMLNLNFSVG